MIKEIRQIVFERLRSEPRPAVPTLKQTILKNIRKLDNFPKIGMIVDDEGTVEDKWGIEIAWERSNPDSTHPDTGVVLTWHGLHRGEVARCNYNHSNRIKYTLDFRTLTEVEDGEYSVYARKAIGEISMLITRQRNAKDFPLPQS